jgi:predicted GH43/DUF377 family glycosyl hydrolase
MPRETSVNRRQLIVSGGLVTAGCTVGKAKYLWGKTVSAEWKEYAGNPVLGGKYGTCFDICVLREPDQFVMWLSWRPKKSIAVSYSKDGKVWTAPEIALGPLLGDGWEDDLNRPVVVKRPDGYHMWYTGQTKTNSKIGYAFSQDGKTWVRPMHQPVLTPELPWEGVAVMCPHVMWDEQEKVWKMWYSGGEQYEPNAIGYATSVDGRIWNKLKTNPVLKPLPSATWEQERVTAAQIMLHKGWYYAFYVGFRDVDHAQIGLARSRDGITNWERHPENPIIRPTPGGFDSDACYKPYAVLEKGRWMLWYNGRNVHLEQIGLATHDGEDLGFGR